MSAVDRAPRSRSRGPLHREFYWIKKTLVSSNIKTATTVDVTTYVRGEDAKGVRLEGLFINSDSATGLGSAGNPALQLKIAPVTGKYTGTPPGLLIPWSISAAKTALGAAKTVDFDGGTVKVKRDVPRGCKIVALGSDADFTGAGTIDIYLMFSRISRREADIGPAL